MRPGTTVTTQTIRFSLFILAASVASLAQAVDAVSGATSTPPDSLSQATQLAPHERHTVRFGFLKPMVVYGKHNYQPGETDIRRPLEEYLVKTLPDLKFEFVEYPLPALGEAAKRHEIDFALMSAGQYVETQTTGAYALATVYTSRFPDPNRFTGALYVVSSRIKNVSDIKDMKGLRAAFNSRANFINYQIPLGEVARLGYDPDNFFSQQLFTQDRPEEVLRLILEGYADVGVFRICEYETLLKLHPEYRSAFIPVGVKKDQQSSCLRSTDLYPGWTVTRTAVVNPAITARIAKALLTMPVNPTNGMGWSIATEFERVNEVFRLIKAGPYEHLREWTVKRVWDTYWQVIIALGIFVLIWVWHWLSVERLAQRRAQALNEAYVKQKTIEDEVIKAQERLAVMSRLGVVSQLSAIFAHEMGQPLSAIRYRTKALETLLKNAEGKEALIEGCLTAIHTQSEKAARILQKVRSYAKGNTDRNQSVDMKAQVEKVISDLRQLGKLTVALETKLDEVTVYGDELELGLAVFNILKNAAEAAQSGAGTKIYVRLTQVNERMRLVVENDGSLLDKDTLTEHMMPMSSQKEEGIGLGIIIISSIAEAHGGSFSLVPLDKGGAVAALEIPLHSLDPHCPNPTKKDHYDK